MDKLLLLIAALPVASSTVLESGVIETTISQQLCFVSIVASVGCVIVTIYKVVAEHSFLEVK